MNFTDKVSVFADSKSVSQLGRFRHHLVYTTLEHSIHVTKTSYALAKALRVKVDEDAMLRGAMLHDFFLYERAAEGMSPAEHFAVHPEIAVEKASQYYALTEKERNIILSHMWPINRAVLPQCSEAWLVSIADKLCTTWESSIGLAAAALGVRKEQRQTAGRTF